MSQRKLTLPSIEALRQAFAYDSETGEIRWAQFRTPRWVAPAGEIAGCINRVGYRYVCFQSVDILAHRLAWALHI